LPGLRISSSKEWSQEIGVVTSRIIEIIYEQYEIWISESIIYVWEEKFSRNIPKHEFENLSKLLHDDDTQIPTKRKGRKLRQFGLKCPKTKVIKTYIFVHTRSNQNRQLPSYYPAINKVFGTGVECALGGGEPLSEFTQR